MDRVGAPVLSPDGRWAVFSVVEPSYDADKQTSDLWIVPTDGTAAPRRLTASRGPESSVSFSPDGKGLLFSAKREGDDAAQIYLLPLDGGEAQRLTTLSTGAGDPLWRPDGKAILFQSAIYPGAADDEANRKIAAERKARKSNARVYDSFPFRFWNTWLDDRKPHLFVQELTPGAKAVDLLAGTKLASSPGFGGAFNAAGGGQSLTAAWSRDGHSIVFAAVVNRDQEMYADVHSALFQVSVSGGEPQRISPEGMSYSNPQFSPDGKYLIAHCEQPATPEHPYHLTRLARFTVSDWGQPAILTSGWDRSAGRTVFSSDGKSLWIDAEDDGFDRLFQVPVAGGKVEVLYETKAGTLGDIQVARGVVVGRTSGALNPGQIVRADFMAKSVTPLTQFNQARLAQLILPQPEHFWFTAKDGRRIHCLIVPPPSVEAGKKYPIVVFPHGGPNSMSKDAFSTRWNFHLLTAPGYYLLMPDYMGSTGFGEKFADDIERDVLRGPAKEILEAVTVAAERYPGIDLSRQAAVGASYGGYLMNWFNGTTKQFRCLVNHAGAVNNISQYGVNDGGWSREIRMGGPVWEMKGQWTEQSPFVYASQWKTPMLITQGEQDFRVPYSESSTTFKILQRLRIPSRLVLFPDAGHWVLKGYDNKLHMDELRNWLHKYLDPAEPLSSSAN